MGCGLGPLPRSPFHIHLKPFPNDLPPACLQTGNPGFIYSPLPTAFQTRFSGKAIADYLKEMQDEVAGFHYGAMRPPSDLRPPRWAQSLSPGSRVHGRPRLPCCGPVCTCSRGSEGLRNLGKLSLLSGFPWRDEGAHLWCQ